MDEGNPSFEHKSTEETVISQEKNEAGEQLEPQKKVWTVDDLYGKMMARIIKLKFQKINDPIQSEGFIDGESVIKAFTDQIKSLPNIIIMDGQLNIEGSEYKSGVTLMKKLIEIMDDAKISVRPLFIANSDVEELNNEMEKLGAIITKAKKPDLEPLYDFVLQKLTRKQNEQ